MPVCARKQTNGPPVIGQGFSLQETATAIMHCQAEQCTHPPPPVSLPCPTLSANAEPIFKTDCAN